MNELTQFGQLISQLKQASGTNNRKKLLKQVVQNVNSKLATLWWWTLNPMVTFGITDVPSKDPLSLINKETVVAGGWDGLISLLQRLRKRELTGHDAQSYVYRFYKKLPTDDAKKAFRALLRRQPDCGISQKSLNDVFPSFLPEFRVALAKEWNEAKVEKAIKECKYVLVEPKFDGERRIFVNSGGTPAFYTRAGHLDESLPELVAILSDVFPIGTVIDGELWPRDNNFNRLRSVCKKIEPVSLEEANVAFVPFDALTLVEWYGTSSIVSQRDRSIWVQRMVAAYPSEYVWRAISTAANSLDEVENLYYHYLNQGLEGIIVKRPDANYSFKRSHDWIKKKSELTVDLNILQILPGEPNTMFANSLGRIACYHGNVLVKVAPGKMSHELRQTVYDDPASYIGKTIEVMYQEETPDGSLRHPRFFRFRPDKD